MAQPKNYQMTKNWYCINDSIVKPVHFQQLASQFSGSQSAYILIYRKVGIEKPEFEIPKQIK